MPPPAVVPEKRRCREGQLGIADSSVINLSRQSSTVSVSFDPQAEVASFVSRPHLGMSAPNLLLNHPKTVPFCLPGPRWGFGVRGPR